MSQRERAESLKGALESRPEKSEVVDQGVLLEKTPVAATLEKNLKKATLSNSLKDRPTRESLEDSAILIDQTPEAHALEKNLAKSMLSRNLNATNRPSYEALKEDNIIVDNFKTKDLEKAMNKDSVKVGLEKRAEAEDLKEKRVLKTPNEATKESLEKNMAKDKLAKELTKGQRPTVEDLKDTGVVKDGIRVRSESLTKEMVKTSLKSDLSNRPSVEEVKQQGVLKTTAQANASTLEKRMVADQLKKSVQRRPSVQEVKDMSIGADVVPEAMVLKELKKTESTSSDGSTVLVSPKAAKAEDPAPAAAPVEKKESPKKKRKSLKNFFGLF